MDSLSMSQAEEAVTVVVWQGNNLPTLTYSHLASFVGIRWTTTFATVYSTLNKTGYLVSSRGLQHPRAEYCCVHSKYPRDHSAST